MSKRIIEITGFKELQQKIKTLPEKIQKKEVIKVLRISARPTVAAARSEVPVDTGQLKKSLGIIVGKKGKSKENPTIYVGPRTTGKNNGWYGAIVHGGRKVYRAGYKRQHKRSSAQNKANAVKFVPGDPYMTRAYNKTKGLITADAEKRVARASQRQIDKLSS